MPPDRNEILKTRLESLDTIEFNKVNGIPITQEQIQFLLDEIRRLENIIESMTGKVRELIDHINSKPIIIEGE